MKGHNFNLLFNLNNKILILYLDGLFLMPSDVSINIQDDGEVKFLLVNCKFPMTSKLHMLHGVNDPYMVIVCKISRLYS